MAWAKPFSKKEDQFIRKNYGKKTVADMARHLGRSRSGVAHRINALGLRGEVCTTRARVMHTDEAQKKRLKTLVEVAREGDELKTLEALRDVLAQRICETSSPRDTAAPSKRMVEVGIRITELQRSAKKETGAQGAEVTSFDVIAGRNAGRRAAAQA